MLVSTARVRPRTRSGARVRMSGHSFTSIGVRSLILIAITLILILVVLPAALVAAGSQAAVARFSRA